MKHPFKLEGVADEELMRLITDTPADTAQAVPSVKTDALAAPKETIETTPSLDEELATCGGELTELIDE